MIGKVIIGMFTMLYFSESYYTPSYDVIEPIISLIILQLFSSTLLLFFLNMTTLVTLTSANIQENNLAFLLKEINKNVKKIKEMICYYMYIISIYNKRDYF